MVKVNKAGRVFFHSAFVVLLGCAYLARSCADKIYPEVFCFLGFYIMSQQIFDLALYRFDYLIDWKNIPPLHINRLYFNKDLF